MKKNNVNIEVFANAVGQLFEVISNTVIHSLKGDQLPTPVHNMFKNPFDTCAEKCFEDVVTKATIATPPSV